MSRDLKVMKQQFLEYVEIEKGRSVKTVQNYDRYLTRFVDYSKLKNAEDISSEKFREFSLWLNRQTTAKNRATGETLKKKTQNY